MADLSLTGARWTAVSVPDDRIQRIQRSTQMSEVAARCLAARWDGDTLDRHLAHGLLRPDLNHLHDPYLMMGLGEGVERLRYALAEKQHIRIITDYDVDGTTSSLILQAALKLVNRDVRLTYHIPNRFGEGYGFSPIAANKAIEDGVDLIVTADIGVRDHAAVNVARAGGVDVMICDHHLPKGADVPEQATVLCPPQIGDTYPNRSLAACGVSLKLAQAMLADHPHAERIVRSLLKLAAIGTVADLVPLTSLENRAIVGLGVHALNEGPHHAGLQALLDVSGLKAGNITERDLGYRVGPRINAAGRLADAKLVVRLLNCRDKLMARELAEELNYMNRNRQEIQKKLVELALDGIGDKPDPFVVVSGSEAEGWHRGVVGIVASKVKDESHRPTAVISIQGELAVGSVRSIPGIHAVKALDSASDLLVKYGGHPAAAGFTIPVEHLDALKKRLSSYVSSHADVSNFVAEHSYDAEMADTELTTNTMRELDKLGPFGMGNPKPRLVVRNVKPVGVAVRGKTQALLKFQVPRQRGGSIEALWWGRADMADTLQAGPIDVLGTLSENHWNGRTSLEFTVTDARRA
jgi:single-stranded-DNA-specific exonuclease